MPTYAISAENLTYRYGDLLAVDHINFDVAEGEILGFLSGMTYLILVCAQLPWRMASHVDTLKITSAAL